MIEYEHPEWHKHAPCNGMTELFFPERGVDSTPARAICAQCPFRPRCLRENMHEVSGVWGGTTGKQRQKMRRVAKQALLKAQEENKRLLVEASI